MPRPKSPAVSYHQLVALLGAPVRERADFIAIEGNSLRPPRKLHRGWSWRCGCASFAREDGASYLYVACVGHSTPPPAVAS
jgi:hypothetical protein